MMLFFDTQKMLVTPANNLLIFGGLFLVGIISTFNAVVSKCSQQTYCLLGIDFCFAFELTFIFHI